MAIDATPLSSSPPRGRPKSVRRREDILAAATHLFDARGYVNTSLDDIAQAVGIRREGLYYYFRNRAEILLSIIEPQSQALIDGLRSIVDDKFTPPRAKLEAAIRNHLERFDRYCLEMTVSLRDGLLEDTGETRDRMNGIWRRYETLWQRIVQQGLDDNAFRPIGDARMIAFGILGMCNWLSRWYDPAGPTSVEDLCKTYVTLVCDGLSLPAA